MHVSINKEPLGPSLCGLGGIARTRRRPSGLQRSASTCLGRCFRSTSTLSRASHARSSRVAHGPTSSTHQHIRRSMPSRSRRHRLRGCTFGRAIHSRPPDTRTPQHVHAIPRIRIAQSRRSRPSTAAQARRAGSMAIPIAEAHTAAQIAIPNRSHEVRRRPTEERAAATATGAAATKKPHCIPAPGQKNPLNLSALGRLQIRLSDPRFSVDLFRKRRLATSGGHLWQMVTPSALRLPNRSGQSRAVGGSSGPQASRVYSCWPSSSCDWPRPTGFSTTSIKPWRTSKASLGTWMTST